jgi:hypothetical protein
MSSCVKDKITGITDNSVYTPEFALPVGSHDFLLKDSPIADLQLFDTSNIPDNVDYLSYNDTILEYVPYIVLSSEDQFQFSSITDKTQYITSLVLRTNIINGIPDSAHIQMYFLDNSHNVIDSIFSGKGLKILAASVDNHGNITESADLERDTPLTNLISNLSSVSYIRTRTILYLGGYKNTGTGYYSDQHIWTQMGIQVKLELPLNEI